MEIGNMTFTDEERKALIEHRDSIVKFVYENYVGKLKEELKYNFGGKYIGSRSFNETSYYHIGVLNEPATYWDGNRYSKTETAILFGEKYGGLWTNFETTTNPYVIYPVVYYWGEIKRALNNMKINSDFMHSQIENFKI